jgi:hypothetical protein
MAGGRSRSVRGDPIWIRYLVAGVACAPESSWRCGACNYMRESQEMVFDAHDKAFAFFHGTCTRGIYDNMKTAVKAVFVARLSPQWRDLLAGSKLIPAGPMVSAMSILNPKALRRSGHRRGQLVEQSVPWMKLAAFLVSSLWSMAFVCCPYTSDVLLLDVLFLSHSSCDLITERLQEVRKRTSFACFYECLNWHPCHKQERSEFVNFSRWYLSSRRIPTLACLQVSDQVRR